MKSLLLLSVLLTAFFLSGCETIVETRRPIAYGTVYNDGYYREPHRDYYYRNGRRYDRNERDVVVVNRPVVNRSRSYVRRPNTVVVRRSSHDRDRHDDRKDRRDHKKKHSDDDDR